MSIFDRGDPMSIEEKRAETVALATDVNSRTLRTLQHIEKGEWTKAHAEYSNAMVQSLRMLQAVAIMKAIEEGLVTESLREPPKEPYKPKPKVWKVWTDIDRPLMELEEINEDTKGMVEKAFLELSVKNLAFIYQPKKVRFDFYGIAGFLEDYENLLALQRQSE